MLNTALVTKLIAATAVLVAVAAIATGQWEHLVYVGAVVVALAFWRPSWQRATLPSRSAGAGEDDTEQLKSARRWRRNLLPAWGLAVLLMGYALKHLIVGGQGMLAVLLATTVAFGLSVWLALVQRRVEALSDGEEHD